MTQLFALVLREANSENIKPTSVPLVVGKGTKITVSRFEPNPSGYVMWADFNVPKTEGVAFGTCEIVLSPEGAIVSIQTVGQLVVAPLPRTEN